MAVGVGFRLSIIGLGAALPAWRYVMKNEREEELLFRADQIAHAVACFQVRRGQALPTSLDMLVEAKCLRKAWKDPMTADGAWRFRQSNLPTNDRPLPGGSQLGPGQQEPKGPVPFIGVASRSTEKSLRVVNGRMAYNEWLINAHPAHSGHEPIVGRPPPGQPPGTRPLPIPSSK